MAELKVSIRPRAAAIMINTNPTSENDKNASKDVKQFDCYATRTDCTPQS